jgi:hypothetical protein
LNRNYITKELNDYEENRNFPALTMITNNINNNEGPLIHNLSELQKDEFGSTAASLINF